LLRQQRLLLSQLDETSVSSLTGQISHSLLGQNQQNYLIELVLFLMSTLNQLSSHSTLHGLISTTLQSEVRQETSLFPLQTSTISFVVSSEKSERLMVKQ